jgi:hypothetical protein
MERALQGDLGEGSIGSLEGKKHSPSKANRDDTSGQSLWKSYPEATSPPKLKEKVIFLPFPL